MHAKRWGDSCRDTPLGGFLADRVDPIVVPPHEYNETARTPTVLFARTDQSVSSKNRKLLVHRTDFLEAGSRDIHRATGDGIESGLDRLEIDRSVDWLPEADQGEARS